MTDSSNSRQLPRGSTKAPRIRRVRFATADFEAEAAWWGKLFPPHNTAAQPIGGAFEVRVGNGSIQLTEADQKTGRPCHHIALEVAEDRLVEASRWLATASELIPARGSETGSAIVDFPAWAAHSVYAKSPSGHVIELIARHRRPWQPALRSDSRTADRFVRGISEIGVIAPDVRAVVERLEDHQINRWFGDPESGFCAVGDEAGLLICARERRNWFPTQSPSALGPLQIDLAGHPGLPPGERIAVGSRTLLSGVAE